MFLRWRSQSFFFKVVISLKTLVMRVLPSTRRFSLFFFSFFCEVVFFKMVVLMPSLGRVTGHISFIIPGVFLNWVLIESCPCFRCVGLEEDASLNFKKNQRSLDRNPLSFQREEWYRRTAEHLCFSRKTKHYCYCLSAESISLHYTCTVFTNYPQLIRFKNRHVMRIFHGTELFLVFQYSPSQKHPDHQHCWCSAAGHG